MFAYICSLLDIKISDLGDDEVNKDGKHTTWNYYVNELSHFVFYELYYTLCGDTSKMNEKETSTVAMDGMVHKKMFTGPQLMIKPTSASAKQIKQKKRLA